MPAANDVAVEILSQTIRTHNGSLQRLWPGQVVRVAPELAEQWEGHGIAKRAVGKAPTPPEELQRLEAEQPARQEMYRTDLRVRSLHGDVEAARALDALGEDPVHEPAQGTPPPLTDTPVATDEPAPAQTTGLSARQQLGRR